MALRVATWASWAEWNAVYEQLASPSPAQRAVGVRRVQTWRTRGRLPIAIDLTGSFVEIMLNDPALNPTTTAPRGEHELQLMYSMAVVRLVNGVVDLAQKGASARSIAVLAKELDWPKWFVDLRHEATHQKLPSLTLLRLAAQEAVWLLLERFWRPQLSQVEARKNGKADGLRSLAPPRDRRFLSKRLRRLVHAAVPVGAGARRRKQVVAAAVAGASAEEAVEQMWATQDGNSAAMAAAEAQAVRAAQKNLDSESTDLASVGADESRLLGLLFETTLSKPPRVDGREARAVHALCARTSENFALRLARCLAGGSLGWRDLAAQPEPAGDAAPSMRNICDACHGDAPADERYGAGRAAPDPDLMMQWLEALLLTPPSTSGEPPQTRRAEAARARKLAKTTDFGRALTSVAPLLRDLTFKRIAATASRLAPSSDSPAEAAAAVSEAGGVAALGERATRFWELLASSGLRDATADSIFSCLTASPPPAGDDDHCSDAHVSNSPTARLAEMEEFLQSRKRRRTAADGADVASTEAAATEADAPHIAPQTLPWTSVGTWLDPKTLEVRCLRERDVRAVGKAAPNEAASTDATPAATAESDTWSVQTATALWQHWCSAAGLPAGLQPSVGGQ
eukprot:TRINITY_DN18387_c0_g1_i2.p1 TRINITY_DN18387_c0_g1~~TRINITY_DN18387_c0_g1_i2.p1  ORF type:complete len:663 (+),score=130.71 TRINITY_DN18387_c0_g1_i2:112-1989(+)